MAQNPNISSNTPPQVRAYTSYESSFEGTSKRKTTMKKQLEKHILILPLKLE